MATVPVHPVFLKDDPVNDPVNDTVNDRFGPIALKGRQLTIYEMIEKNDRVTTEEMKERCIR